MRKRIVATLVLIFVLFSIYHVIMTQAATTAVINMYLNITPGSLSIDAGPTVEFPDYVFDPNGGINRLTNLSLINIVDTRGSGIGWSITAYSNLMWASNSAVVPMKNNIANSSISIRGGALGAWNSSSTTGIYINQTNQLLNAANVIANAGNGYGSGAYYIGNSLLNVLITNNAVAGLYGGWLTLTIS